MIKHVNNLKRKEPKNKFCSIKPRGTVNVLIVYFEIHFVQKMLRPYKFIFQEKCSQHCHCKNMSELWHKNNTHYWRNMKFTRRRVLHSMKSGPFSIAIES